MAERATEAQAIPAPVGIVVLNWNNEPATHRLLASLDRLSSPAHRVYVVDNGSTDGSMDRLERDFAARGHAWIRNGANLGFAAGCNPGIRRALADGAGFVLLLNNDCVVEDPRFLSHLVAAAHAAPRRGLVGGKLLCWPERERIWSTGGFVSGWRQRYVGAGELDRGQHDRPEPRTFLSGALLLVRRDVFDAIGLLPEEYFFGHEDWEFSWRARRAGFELWYEPRAIVLHEAGKSHDAIDPMYVYNDALSRMLFEKRVLSKGGFRLWHALYGVYLAVALPVWFRLRRRRYLAGAPASTLVSCLRAAHRDIEWREAVTARDLARFRAGRGDGVARPLRVAHLVATVGQAGMESHLRVLFVALREAGQDPYLVAPGEGPLTRELRARGFEVRIAAPRGRLGGWQLVRTARALAGADLVHAHGPRALWWSAMLVRAGGAPPAVATAHQLDQSGVGSRWRRPIYRRIERWALRAQRAVVAVSEGLRDELVRIAGLPPSRVRTIPNSAPILLDPPSPARPADAPPRVVYAGRLSREKGVDRLLEAWADRRLAGNGVILDVLGDGPERGALAARVQELGLDGRVRFRGWLEDVRDEIAGALLYVAPSRVETFGIAVLEAMTLGVPVLASDVAGHRELLAGAFDDLLVPEGVEGALADALVDALARGPAWRATCGARLAHHARQRFSPAELGRAMGALYAEVAGARGRVVAASPPAG